MHEAKWSRAKVTHEQQTALFERPFRAQETNAPHDCGLERHFSSMLRLQDRLERHPSSILRLRGGSSTHRAFCGSESDSSGTRRAFCGSGAGSSGHFEPSAAPGRARAAISSHLRFRGGLERPFRAICGSGAGSSSHFEPSAAQGQARAAFARRSVASEKPKTEANFMNRYWDEIPAGPAATPPPRPTPPQTKALYPPQGPLS